MVTKIIDIEQVVNTDTVGAAVPGRRKIFMDIDGNIKMVRSDGATAIVSTANGLFGYEEATLYYEDAPTIPSTEQYVKIHAKIREGRKEVCVATRITTMIASAHFEFYTQHDENFINVWYSIDSAGSPPGLGGLEVEVALTSAEASVPATVWSKTKDALDALDLGLVVTQYVPQAVRIEMGEVGAATDIVSGDDSITVGVDQQGGDVEGPFKVVLAEPYIDPGTYVSQRIVVEIVSGTMAVFGGNDFSAELPIISEYVWTGTNWTPL